MTAGGIDRSLAERRYERACRDDTTTGEPISVRQRCRKCGEQPRVHRLLDQRRGVLPALGTDLRR